MAHKRQGNFFSKNWGYIMAAVFILVFVFAGVALISLIKSYNEEDIQYEDCLQKEFTFVSAEETFYYNRHGKRHTGYKIYIEGTNKYLKISSVHTAARENKLIENLEQGETLYLFVLDKGNYYDVTEIKTQTDTVYSLQTYVARSRQNIKVGLIFLPIFMVVVCLGGVAVFIYVQKKHLA